MGNGIARESLEGVRNTLHMHGQVSSTGLTVSEISRELNDLARATVYKALDILEAQRDETFYPPTYTLPVQGTEQRDISIKLAVHLLATGESDETETTTRILALI